MYVGLFYFFSLNSFRSFFFFLIFFCSFLAFGGGVPGAPAVADLAPAPDEVCSRRSCSFLRLPEALLSFSRRLKSPLLSLGQK
jgi:hypothetical protein